MTLAIPLARAVDENPAENRGKDQATAVKGRTTFLDCRGG